MSGFSVNMDSLLTSVNTLAATIPGIRKAFNYSDWPTRPPGEPNKEQAYHFTGFPGEELGVGEYQFGGMDLAQYRLLIPMYTVVAPSGNLNRSRAWAAPYTTRYPEFFRDHGQLNGAITAGSAMDTPMSWTVVYDIPAFPAFHGFYILRWQLGVLTKGAHTNQP